MLEIRGGRNFGLDVLRCVAIAGVLANHAFLGFFVVSGGVAWVGRKAAVSTASVLAVEWLFVLSGFLIGAMMVRSFEKAGTWWTRARSFWLRRWFRTVPNYYLFLLVNVLLSWLAINPDAGFQWRYVVFAQNLAWPEHWPPFFNEAWSLALDEWFYLVMPFLLLATLAIVPKAARVRNGFLLATATLILVPTALRATADVPATIWEWDITMRRVTVMHLDATGWGVLAAVTSRWWPGFWTRNRRAKAALGVALVAGGLLLIESLLFPKVAVASPWFAATFGLTCVGIGTFLALPAVAALPVTGPRLQRGVQVVSDWTYSIYLSHFPILYLLVWLVGAPLTPTQSWLLVAAWLPLTVAVSAAVYRFFERPVLQMRERFTERVSAVPFAAPPEAATPRADDAPATDASRSAP